MDFEYNNNDNTSLAIQWYNYIFSKFVYYFVRHTLFCSLALARTKNGLFACVPCECERKCKVNVIDVMYKSFWV